ncbi:hypothetical protein HMPREF1430_00298 [Helicobacter pylori GAM96Ai]|nr:hypothetical protein HMPREF1430_00298 [Helicobacter pylori GAM96Ai]
MSWKTSLFFKWDHFSIRSSKSPLRQIEPPRQQGSRGFCF